MVEETERKQDEYEHEYEPEPKLGRRLLLARASVRPRPLSVLPFDFFI
jgi:hypothetical protein